MVKGNSKDYNSSFQEGLSKERIVDYLRKRIIEDLKENPQTGQRLSAARIIDKVCMDSSTLCAFQKDRRINKPKSKDGELPLYSRRDTAYLLYVPPSEGETYVPDSLEAIFNLKDREGEILASTNLIRRNNDGSLNGQDIAELFNEVFPHSLQGIKYKQREKAKVPEADSEVRRYFDEIGDFEPYSRTEEINLVKKWKAGDESARTRLLEANLKFVVSVAKKYQNPSVRLADLIEQGNLGLITAFDRFNERLGFKFITYAVWWIRQSITQYLKDSSRNVRVPQNVSGDITKVNRIIRGLEETLGIGIDPFDYIDIIAKRLGKSEETALRVMLARSPESSLDALFEEYDERTLLSILPDKGAENPEVAAIDKDVREVLLGSLKDVTSREAEILRLYFGLIDGEKAWTLKEIGERMGLTRERIRQLRNRALGTLKRRCNDTLMELREY